MIVQPRRLQRIILLKASRNGHEPIVKMMLDLGTDPGDPHDPDEDGDYDFPHYTKPSTVDMSELQKSCLTMVRLSMAVYPVL